MSLMIEMMDIAVQGVSHRWTPASGTSDAYGILRFGTSVRGVTVYFHKPAEIDEAIAELVALRAEMDPPVITDSERTCDQAHPETGAWCHLPAPHAEHRDTNGETWAAVPGVVRSAFPCCEHCTPRCDGQGHDRACTTPRCPAATGQGGVLFPAGDDDEPACECSHPQDDHDDDSRDHECRRKGCGCLRWRTAAPKAQPEPPRVVAGTVVPRLRRLAVAE